MNKDWPYIPHADPFNPIDSPSIDLALEGSTLTTGRPDWLKQVEEKRKVVSFDGVTFRERDIGTRHCLIVRDYADLTDGAADLSELLCMSSQGPVFIDLGDAPKDHDLIINAESGKVYVNDHAFDGMVGLMSLGDGSWAVAFDHGTQPDKPGGLFGWIIDLYQSWLDEVYNRCAHFGLIENNPLYERSFWRLFINDLPKGKIISKKSKLVLDKQYTS